LISEKSQKNQSLLAGTFNRSSSHTHLAVRILWRFPLITIRPHVACAVVLLSSSPLLHGQDVTRLK